MLRADSVIPFHVDWLTLSMRVDRATWDQPVRWSRKVSVEGAVVDIAVGQVGLELRARIDFNPARVVEPCGWRACSPTQARAAAQHVRERLGLMTPLLGDTLEATVPRIDVAKDLSTVSPEFYIKGLFSIRRPYDKIGELFRDPRRSGALTVTAGSKRGGIVKLYDKGAEQVGAPAGTLRFEASCRRSWATRFGGITRLRDVTDESVSQLGMNRWDWSRFGREVASSQPVIERALRMGWTKAQVERVLGRLLAQAQMGIPPKPGSDRIDRLCRDLDMVMSLDSPDGDPAFVGRLNLALGTEEFVDDSIGAGHVGLLRGPSLGLRGPS